MLQQSVSQLASAACSGNISRARAAINSSTNSDSWGAQMEFEVARVRRGESKWRQCRKYASDKGTYTIAFQDGQVNTTNSSVTAE